MLSLQVEALSGSDVTLNHRHLPNVYANTVPKNTDGPNTRKFGQPSRTDPGSPAENVYSRGYWYDMVHSGRS